MSHKHQHLLETIFHDPINTSMLQPKGKGQ
jgi:hypothetical protein